ncbi:OLC1v1013728C1 [Oldenlandia corymbosa var. corymbosa]|uniref:OLC1v1013728C1 n=1 Tax=Oldenlandia corymbosa var. corymbosa TaxID=529605 RepID=A0AAV1DZE6_OLDCO|nr:OLC1v1013728C1 [Oldenlandia corymbosa var. corymbosa]
MKVAENEADGLTNAINQLFTTLSDSVPQTQCFKSKWSLVASKLSNLQTLVSDLSTSCSVPTTASAAASGSLSSDLLQSLHVTLSDASSLCALCHAPTPPHGKLKTQNEIDSITAKLDHHIKDLDVLIKSGVLLNHGGGGAAAAAAPASRESVRAEFRNLITRLQIGSSESKNATLDSVLSLLNEDDKNVLIAVAQGIVPVLVRVLDSSAHHLEMKEKIVAAIAKISTADSVKHVLIAEGLGILNNLLRVLESGSVFAKERCCVVLQVLSQSKENARAIGSRGGISSLLEICNSGAPNSQAMAGGVLRSLSVFPEIKEYFAEENAVIILLGVLNSGTTLAQENAIGCLNNLANNDQNTKLLIAREGVIESLKNYWDSVNSVQSLEVAIVMVQILSSCPLIVEIIVENGFLNRVTGVLNCGVLGVRVAAAKAIYEMAYNTRTRKELGELGCISSLSRMLDGKAVEEKEAAAKALSNLLNYVGNRRIFRKEEKGIISAVQLLDPLVQNLDKKYPVLVLSSLVHSKKCRKQMVGAGACSHLQKLVELNNDVDGAKKLFDSLDRGKLWGVFDRH